MPASRDYAPSEHAAGQPIEYTRTGSQAAEGITHAGVIWSDGPQPRTVWVSPDGLPRSFAHMTLVCLPTGGRLPHVAYSYADPRTMTTLA